MAKKIIASKTELSADVKNVLIWKVSCPLTEVEHEQLSSKLRYEQEQSGVTIVLVPYSVTVEVQESIPIEDEGNAAVAPGGEADDE